jgi:hypothetical protein
MSNYHQSELYNAFHHLKAKQQIDSSSWNFDNCVSELPSSFHY